MPFQDLLLHIDSYPDGTTPEAIEEAVNIASAMAGKLTALAMHVAIPIESNRLADYLINLSDVVRDLEDASLETCRSSLAHFKAKATAAAVFADARVVRSGLLEIPAYVAARARTRDLCILPLGGRFDAQHEVVQRVIFESGRPAVVFQSGSAPLANGLGNVVVAWDGGLHAARALAEALPLLATANEVRILTIVDEKPSAKPGLGDEVVRHLAAHGTTAVVDEVAADRRKIGVVLDAYLDDRKPDLLVMGAYGHSRFREIVLGGATEHMLFNPKVPVFLVH